MIIGAVHFTDYILLQVLLSDDHNNEPSETFAATFFAPTREQKNMLSPPFFFVAYHFADAVIGSPNFSL